MSLAVVALAGRAGLTVGSAAPWALVANPALIVQPDRLELDAGSAPLPFGALAGRDASCDRTRVRRCRNHSVWKRKIITTSGDQPDLAAVPPHPTPTAVPVAVEQNDLPGGHTW